jgi:predicted nucleic acid-binding protein
VLFVDTVFYVAVIDPHDQFRPRVDALMEDVVAAHKVTTDAVLMEVLAWAGTRGAFHRAAGLALIDEVRRDPKTTIVRQTPELFDAGLELYRRRPDKGYSLADCISMLMCEERRITNVLTNDHHFTQEGFTVLL